MEKVFIDISQREICDLYLILKGGLFPLHGFMTEMEYLSVINICTLPSGEVFPIPVVLIINDEQRKKVKIDDEIFLRIDKRQIVAKMKITDIYSPDILLECEKVYGTIDNNHPGVHYLLNLKNNNKELWYVGGHVVEIDEIKWFSYRELRKTPEEIKKLTENYQAIVGFQTRNPLHKAHVNVILKALEIVSRDTKMEQIIFLLHPTIGPTQLGDININIRIQCYLKLLKYLPKNTILSVIPLAMRMAGPKEALFHAIIRKNYGCTHFIIGRDPAAPSTKNQFGDPFYMPYSAHELAKKFQNKLGINIICIKDMFFVPIKNVFVSEDSIDNNENKISISGTELRKKLKNNEPIPEWFAYTEIIEELRIYYLNRGICFWFTGLSGSGKTTLAYALRDRLKEQINYKKLIFTLDGDELREMMPLGFSINDRNKNVNNASRIASKIIQEGGIAIISLISPLKKDRKMAREMITESDGEFIEIFVDTPIHICENRDPKGLYQKAKKGEIIEFTGIDSPYEIPENPEIIISNNNSLDDSFENLWNMILPFVKMK